MNSRILTLKDKEEWIRLIESLPHEQQDIYYTPEYYSLYENYGDGKTMCFVFEKDQDIALYPFLMNSVNKLGYILDDEYFDIQGAYGYNGVVSSSYDNNFNNCFYKAFNSFCNENNIVAEFTRFNPLLNNVEFSRNYLDAVFNRNTVKITLSNYKTIDDLIIHSYTREARKNIKKAIKQNLKYSFGTTESDYRTFYQLYYDTMKHLKVKSYYYFSENFFIELYNKLKSYFTLILVWYEKTLVGGFLIFLNKTFANNFLSSGSVDFRFLKINDYMQDVAIRYAYENGCKMLHLGGGNSSKPDDPLFNFKRKFSNERGSFEYGKKIYNHKVYSAIISQWSKKTPDLFDKNKNLFLGYREV